MYYYVVLMLILPKGIETIGCIMVSNYYYYYTHYPCIFIIICCFFLFFSSLLAILAPQRRASTGSLPRYPVFTFLFDGHTCTRSGPA
ncbi:hypothetical protein FB45DRAFT_914331 [Roridomyces roridus]|uniref:Uncharacterized protein n=1 Tax=Roridomyces roridus TaxID=1738132 RepID=A0AAD7BXL6_9AGAR|nr:hypothetical protein FB45DRAFT_914331 [Roridomyces roridus]